MATKTAIMESDVSVTYETTDVAVEIRTEQERTRLITALQDDENAVILLRGDHQRVNVHIYLRCNELKRPTSGAVPYATRTQHERPPPSALKELLEQTEETITLTQFADNDEEDASRAAARLHLAMAEMIRRAYEAGLDASARASDGFRKPATSREKSPASDIPVSYPPTRGKLFKEE